MYSCDDKAELSATLSSLKGHMILQKSLQYADLVQKKCLVIISVVTM